MSSLRPPKMQSPVNLKLLICFSSGVGVVFYVLIARLIIDLISHYPIDIDGKMIEDKFIIIIFCCSLLGTVIAISIFEKEEVRKSAKRIMYDRILCTLVWLATVFVGGAIQSLVLPNDF